MSAAIFSNPPPAWGCVIFFCSTPANSQCPSPEKSVLKLLLVVRYRQFLQTFVHEFMSCHEEFSSIKQRQ